MVGAEAVSLYRLRLRITNVREGPPRPQPRRGGRSHGEKAAAPPLRCGLSPPLVSPAAGIERHHGIQR